MGALPAKERLVGIYLKCLAKLGLAGIGTKRLTKKSAHGTGMSDQQKNPREGELEK